VSGVCSRPVTYKQLFKVIIVSLSWGVDGRVGDEVRTCRAVPSISAAWPVPPRDISSSDVYIQPHKHKHDNETIICTQLTEHPAWKPWTPQTPQVVEITITHANKIRSDADTNEIKKQALDIFGRVVNFVVFLRLGYVASIPCCHFQFAAKNLEATEMKVVLKCWILLKNRRLRVRGYCTFFTDGCRHPILNHYPKRFNVSTAIHSMQQCFWLNQWR